MDKFRLMIHFVVIVTPSLMHLQIAFGRMAPLSMDDFFKCTRINLHNFLVRSFKAHEQVITQPANEDIFVTSINLVEQLIGTYSKKHETGVFP